MRPLSTYHPLLLTLSITLRRYWRRCQWRFDRYTYAHTRTQTPLEHRVKKHQSVLIRHAKGIDDPESLQLQQNKVDNLRIVIEQLDGLLIRPGETFSFCHKVGKPTARRGFKLGIELSRGSARPGIGGGICQSSNLLYWLALHTPLTITERHHHSFDPFPDCGRILPFASGATVMYNYRDLRITNTTTNSFQLRLWLDKKCLNGEIRCDNWLETSYSVYEENHYFEQVGERYYRSNELWRKQMCKINGGKILHREHLVTNYAEVKYKPNADQLTRA